MNESDKIALTAAAVTAVGPDVAGDPAAWTAQVTQKAVELAIMVGNDVGKALDAIERCKVFTGTVVGITKEQSSTRGLITLFTGTDQVRPGVPAGHEQIRTERTDSHLGQAMALKIRDHLLGHKVLVYVEVEEYNNGQGKVRVLRHVTDLGIDQAVANQQIAQAS